MSYPALLAVGIGPFAANVTNAVAGVTIGIGSTLSSREELRDQSPRLHRWALPCVAGGTAGAVLLLLTPTPVFDWVVPFLVLGAALALLGQQRLTRWHASRERRGAEPAAAAAVIGVAVYSGYFGAGAGIMILAPAPK